LLSTGKKTLSAKTCYDAGCSEKTRQSYFYVKFDIILRSKSMIFGLYICFMLFLSFTMLPETETTPAAPTLRISNIQEIKGDIYVALYNRREGFLQPEKALKVWVVPVQRKGSIDIPLPALTPGDYAVSCYHDLNSNATLDTNLLGIPTEPYGFSNNARPKFRAPRWQEAKIAWQAGDNMEVRLETW
jgi:uncharacterized protein (DUF2141 family)